MRRLVARRTPAAVAPPVISDRLSASAPIDHVLAPLSQRYVLVYPALQAVTGSAKAALMLSQMLYWTRTYLATRPERGGWFWHTQRDWRASTGLSRHEQDHARAALLATGLVTERRMGTLGRLHFRVDLEALGRAITGHHLKRTSPWCWDEATMKALLGRPIAFQRGLVDVCGSFTAAFYLSDLCQQQRTVARNALHGYITLNGAQREIDAEAGWLDLPLGETAQRLGLSTRRLRLARQTLFASGLIEECSSGGVQPRTLSRVNLPALTIALARLQKTGENTPLPVDRTWPAAHYRPQQPRPIAEIGQQSFDFKGMAETYIPEVTKPANWNGGNVHSRGDESGKLEVTKAAIQNAGFVTSIKVVSTQKEPKELQLPSATDSPQGQPTPRSRRLMEQRVNPNAAVAAERPPHDTASPGLFLPEKLATSEADAARRLLGTLPASVSPQEVADEWAGQLSLGKVHNPLGYLYGLIKRAHSGCFVPAMALQAAEQRARRQQSERALAIARRPAMAGLTTAPAVDEAPIADQSGRRGVPGFFTARMKELGIGRRSECRK